MGFFDFFKKKFSTSFETTNTGNNILLYEKLKNYTVIDLETSSKYSNNANIIELAALKIRNSQISDKYSTLIKPPELIGPEVTGITGITNGMLFVAPTIEQKINEYINFIGNDIILGHNIRAFDCNVLNRVCENMNIKKINNDMIDTLHYAKKCNIDVYNYRLSTLSRYFKIEHDAHRALNDCIANYYIYEHLKPLYDGIYHKPKDRTKLSKSNMKKCSINSEFSDISGKSIVLTGDFEIAEREDIENKLISLGALIKKDVSGKTDYLIIGNLGHSQWYYGSYGRKIEKALELQHQGKKIIMVEENNFFKI